MTNLQDLQTWLDTYAVRRDGSVAFTQPASGVVATDDAHLVTFSQLEDGPSAFRSGTLALTDTSPTSVGAWEDFNGGYVSFADPGRQVDVVAWLASDVETALDEKWRALVRCSISFDGGSSYTAGTAKKTELIGTGTDDVTEACLGAVQRRSGTPTGQVRVKAQLRGEQGSTPSGLDFVNAQLIVMMIPS
jgi:hypothetical protein